MIPKKLTIKNVNQQTAQNANVHTFLTASDKAKGCGNDKQQVW